MSSLPFKFYFISRFIMSFDLKFALRFVIAIVIPLAAVATGLSACQTSRAVAFAYNDATYGGEQYKKSERTSVLFLMDGFSAEMLRNSLKTANVPHIADAFSLSTKARFSYGRAVFPSLTFPNITSILSGRPVSQHPITGNKVMIDDKIVDFENITNWEQLGLSLQRRTIFYRLAEASQTSVSYSYAFSGGATAYQMTSAAAASGYLQNDYASIDTQTIESLKTLLLSTQPAKWPRFIFVHIIGIDATAHTNGPFDQSVQNYLHAIDAQLGDVFQILDHPNGKAAATRDVNYAMTADHGFKATPDYSPLEDVVLRMNRKIKVVSDNRSAPVYINEEMSSNQRLILARALLQVPHVGWAAVKTENGVELLGRNGDHARITIAKTKCLSGELAARFEWLSQPNSNRTAASNDVDHFPQIRSASVPAPALQTASIARAIASLETSVTTPGLFTCLGEFDLATGPDDDSYIVPALVDYFQAPHAPDMVFIPDDHSDFAKGYAGNHGGLSRDEMLVPVLTKGVDFERGIRPTSELIREMGVEPTN
jgi:hypothetical protein